MDLTRILKPGMKLFTPIVGEVTVKKIEKGKMFPILIEMAGGGTCMFTASGKYSTEYEAECLLFPSKGCRFWSNSTIAELLNLGKGDYLVSDTGVFIFNGNVDDCGKFGSIAGINFKNEISTVESSHWCDELRGIATKEEIEDFNTRLYLEHKLVFDKNTCKLIEVNNRVPRGEDFYYIDWNLKIHCMTEYFNSSCNELFNSGNYFINLSKAEECLKEVKQVIKAHKNKS